MANLHTEFQEFNKKLSLSSKRKDRLKASKDALQNRIINYFKDTTTLSAPTFYIQGSYKMGTMILKTDNTYDVDMGVTFDDNQGYIGKSLQKKVLDAVKEHTDGGAQHKQNCIRVIYSGEYNIDLPVFYKNEAGEFMLASKNEDKLDDTRKMVDWFKKQRDDDGQLIRLIKYMKAWADYCSHEMPSGIILTIWLANHFVSNERDDLSLLKTLQKTEDCLWWNGTVCKNPVNKSENLANKLTVEQQKRFRKELKHLIKTLKNAKNNSDHNEAYDSLKPFFGNRF